MADQQTSDTSEAHNPSGDGPTGTELSGSRAGVVGSAAGPTTQLLKLVVVGAVVSLSLGTYARIHTPTGQGITTFGFPAVLPMKAWLTTGAAALAIGQVLSALWMWGRLPGMGSAPSWTAPAHRWLGTMAFLLTIPVAYHCLWALGFQQTTTRVLVHSLLGCAFYGAFVTKMLVLRNDRLPGWSLPAAGGLLVALLTGLWFTSSLWFFTTIGFPGV